MAFRKHPTVCIHHNDPDGRASAAIVRRALGTSVKLYEINYGDGIPWELIESARHVIMVDFSLDQAAMLRIADGRRFTWIDHHVSAIEANADISPHWEGLQSLDEAACVLTWQFFYPGQPVPRAIVLIGDRDIWRMAEEPTRPFGEGLNQENQRPDNDKLWRALLDDDAELVAQFTSHGEILYRARIEQLRRFARRFGYECTFEGHRTLVVNRPGEGELVEIVHDMGYELAYCYVDNTTNGSLHTNVMLGSRSVDVSKIAMKFGGGGHKGAAGFRFERTSGLPFPVEARVTMGDRNR
jgi:oligoribonuclease NrnB/cAMP/cGMP phosphodiesterase (DHH superfamily)